MPYPDDIPTIGELWIRVNNDNGDMVRIRNISHIMNGNTMIIYQYVSPGYLQGAIYQDTIDSFTENFDKNYKKEL
jgi:hypothetical protein